MASFNYVGTKADGTAVGGQCSEGDLESFVKGCFRQAYRTLTVTDPAYGFEVGGISVVGGKRLYWAQGPDPVERPAFTSKTTDRMDAAATEHGWTRQQNDIGDEVEYRRNTLYVTLGLSVTGSVTRAVTNRCGGRNAIGAGKANWVIDQLAGVTKENW
jgi:hypothetical protein